MGVGRPGAWPSQHHAADGLWVEARAVAGVLVLSAVEVRDRASWQWRWLLTDTDTGQALADHTVKLDPADADTDAFADVYRWVRWNADPDRRLTSETTLVARIGTFARNYALGPTIVDAITDRAPDTVRVQVPAGAEWLAFLPWELTHDRHGAALAARGDVTLVYDLPAHTQTVKAPVAGAVRVLAVFSLPTASSLLGLRRERYELTQLITRLRARTGAAIDLTVAQYGTTRTHLQELADHGDGWDVLHLSGHGGAGQFLLEKPDGTPDAVTTEQLLTLLDRARRRVKLVVLSACQSAAATTAETLRWLGLTDQAEPLEAEADQAAEHAAAAQSGLARAVAERFGCAVLAMRYPVTDDYAITLAREFYERLLGRRQPLDRAFTEAVTTAAGPQPTPGAPALSIATPALFGATAINLTLTPPRQRATLDVDDTRMTGFPPEPPRFVGRGPALATASRVLAPQWTATNSHSNSTGDTSTGPGDGDGPVAVVFHGMAGAGKTACALELAYRHRDQFTAHAFWKAPNDPDQFGTALGLLAQELERQLPGFAMVDKIVNPQVYQAFLPRLRTLLRDNGILLILDNLETLLTDHGTWRDPRWAPLIDTLLGHGGQSRTVLTTRTLPTGMPDGTVRVEAVHALTRDETLLLARELPHLRLLLEHTPAPTRDSETGTGDVDAGAEPVLAGQELAVATLEMVQGHPKMLELADAAAADPIALAHAVTTARTALPGARLHAFLTTGATALDGDQLFTALSTWTTTTINTLPPASRVLLQVLCQTEEPDRTSPTLDANWADIWTRLTLPGDPPPLPEALAPLVAAALVAADPSDPTATDPGSPVGYRIHPGITQTVQATTPPQTTTAVDTELAAWYTQLTRYAIDQAHTGHDTTRMIVHAGVHAAPYLLRLHQWDTARALLEQARLADQFNPVTLQTAIPPLEQIACTTGTPQALGTLASALRQVDPARAETLLTAGYQQTVQTGDHDLASAFAGDLISLYRDTGRARQALTLTDEKIEHTRAAGLGPWTQLADQGRRLQLLGVLGQHQDVLDQLPALLSTMTGLPDQPGPDETAIPWNVRETLHDIGRSSALALNQWQDALDHNEQVHASRRRRGATPHELALTPYNDAGPLISLGHYDQADQVLRECQQTYEDTGYISGLGKVFTLRARIAAEGSRDHGNAVRLQRRALRLDYIHPDPGSIAVSHFNLANYLTRTSGDPAEQRAHRLAAALLFTLTGNTHNATDSVRNLAHDLRTTPTTTPDMPTTLDQVAALVEQTEGVQYHQLVTALTDPTTADQTLTQIQHTAQTLDPDQPGQDDTGHDLEGQLARWQPVIAALADVAATGSDIPPELTQLLDDLAATTDWTTLVERLHRVLAGDRDTTTLTTGLDPIDTAILTTLLTHLATPNDTAQRQEGQA